MAHPERGHIQVGRRRLMSRLVDRIIGTEPTSIQLPMVAEDKANNVVFSKVVPTAEWNAVITTMTEARKGRADIGTANDQISIWGASSLFSARRSVGAVGQPYGFEPGEGLKPPIATPADLPNGNEGVQITVDRIAPRLRVLAHS